MYISCHLKFRNDSSTSGSRTLFLFSFLCHRKRRNMVRTKADRLCERVSVHKAPVKISKSITKNSNAVTKGRKYSGGSPYHPRDTPKWQKRITLFLNISETDASSASSLPQKDKDDVTPASDVEESAEEKETN